MTDYIDNTKISTFRQCPRKFYFRHVRHWRPDTTALPLVFGLCWHEAMDIVWGLAASDKSDRDILDLARAEWYEKWLEEGLQVAEDMDIAQIDKMAPRTPGIAFEMIWNYIKLKRPLIAQFKIISIERPFAVPIYPESSDVLYVGRLDKEFKHNGQINIGEHKTTSAYSIKAGFRSTFLDSFSPNSQIDGYLHAGHMEHGSDLKSVWVDAALVHKKVHDQFKFIPIDRQISQLSAWLSDTRQWIDNMKHEANILEAYRSLPESTDCLKCYPKNTGSCFDFNSACSYINLCKSWANPEEHEIPESFIEDEWKPFDVLKLNNIGLKVE